VKILRRVAPIPRIPAHALETNPPKNELKGDRQIPEARTNAPKVPQQEAITSIVVELRLSCALRNPSALPEDLIIHIPGDPTFLDGKAGKVQLEASDGVSYKRLDEEGLAYATQFYQLPAKSFLVGEPIRRCRNMTD